jgi:hypothetical protein
MQLHNTSTPAMRAPAKVAPRKGVRPCRTTVTSSLGGRRTSTDTPRELKKRRVDAHPSLPVSLLTLLTAPKPKGQTGVYVPMARKLEPVEIQAQMDEESSGDDEELTDAYYTELHLHAQRRAEAERGAKPWNCGSVGVSRINNPRCRGYASLLH